MARCFPAAMGRQIAALPGLLLYPAPMNALLQQAIAFDQSGQIAEALAGYQRVLAREPGNIDALFLLGRAYCQQGRLDAGAEVLRQAIARAPTHAPAQNLLGMALERLGHSQEALACFERAAAADPASVAPVANMADSLASLGRHAEAVAQFDRALAMDAKNIVAWCNRGLALEALGRDAEAARSFEHALALGADLPEIHFNLANSLHRLQRFEDAIPHYRRAIVLQPSLARAHGNLGRALLALQRWQEAAESLQQAIKIQPDDVELNDSLGLAQSRLEQYSDSLVSFDRALAIEPKYSKAMANKARSLYVLGRIDEARVLIENAITLDPGNGYNYFELSDIKRFEPGDPHAAAMEKLLADGSVQPADERSILHFALAKAYRDLGDHSKSIQHLMEGNALKRAQFQYDETTVLDSFDRICQLFTPELMQSNAGHGNPSQRPIFIVGMPRSGTTLVEQILASHPCVHGAGEREDFRHALLGLGLAKDYPDCVPEMTPDQFSALGTSYLTRVAASAPSADRITDKLPANFAYAGLIHLALPNARIIHTRRDPLDTCFSCFSISFRAALQFCYDLGELGRFYRAYESVMAHWRQLLPAGVMLEVQYEDVVEDIECEARRILAHCGLEWDPACLAFHAANRPVRTASAAQVRQPIYRSSVGRWRAYRDHLLPLFEALGVVPD